MSDIPEPARYIALIGALILGVIVLAACFVADWGTRNWRQAAITHHAARYNPTTGTFEWLDDVKNEGKP